MVTARKPIIAVVAALSALAVVSPGMAQTREDPVGTARAAAIHDCNNEAVHRYAYVEDGNRSDVYRACMAEHGQVE